ncbi:Vegetative incompatibility protein HET-E-1 [Lachnellula hyalina]|uniref:Vegetative incompatibility protein HET-E-1 n=1 Tax=Lachnellula hyalina TaxID=1316788 RepID=A0A8H8R3S4_9HELO|nr:Vegetative incompatibility protein HET-E-1 [Lachnellula hyalina]TVY27111.1 Vegetative incompatibility protein HET-E-1 [Lachnellula hyalina]
MASAHDAFDDVLSKFKLRLTDRESEDFKFTSLEDVRVALVAIQDEQGRKKEMMNLPRLQAFLEAMEQYGKVVEVFLNVSSVLCFIWGPMKFCLQLVKIASGWAESFEILLDAYKQLAENIPLLQQFQTLFESNLQMSNVLSMIYKDILDFHLSALRVFKKPTWKQLFRSTWKDFKARFQHILDDLRSHKALIEGQANLLQIEEVRVDRERVRESFSSIEKAERDKKFLAVRTWLASTDATVDQEAAAGMRKDYPNTGRWIFGENVIKAWMDSTSSLSSVVWINGIPGAGKTILASRIIEERLRLDQQSTVFFYCKYQDEQRRTFLAIARSVLSQLLNVHDDLLPYLYDQCISSGQVSLVSTQSAVELLRTCLETVPQTYIVIDGIDECEYSERRAILSFFTSLIDNDITPGRLRGLFVSQDENDIRRLLRKASVLRLTEEHNKSDIEAYASRWLSKIELKFEIPDLTLQHIKAAVLGGCEGMFLFAKLVLTNLHDQVSRDKLFEELQPETFPKGFEQAYSRIVNRILTNPKAGERVVTQKLLGWIVSAKRPLKWHEIQGAVSINTKDRFVDFENSHLAIDIRDLCGSLVDVLPGDRVQLVHETAKSYLIHNNYVEIHVEEYRLAVLCMKYLTFDCFDPDAPEERVKEYLMNGSYAFQDYSVLHWVDHLEEVLRFLEMSNISKFNLLGPAVNEFYDTCSVGGLETDEIPQELRERGKSIKDTDFVDNLLHLLNHTRKSRAADDQLSGLGDFGKVINRNRQLLEGLNRSMNLTTVSRQQLEKYYGNNWNKCPRQKCFYFHEGFPDTIRLNNHVSRHEKPFCCTEFSCPRIHLGFSTERELKRHMTLQHPDPAAFAWRFPKIKPPATKYKCAECPKQFTRAHSLNVHVRTHSDDRRFGCRFCTKSFVRKFDCGRHEENLHSEKKQEMGSDSMTVPSSPLPDCSISETIE